MDTQRGTVKWFSRDKGWGFIRLESGDEIFVHHSDIEGDGFVTLEDDEDVEFTVEDMEKGPRARNVRRPGRAPADAGASPGASGARTEGTERTRRSADKGSTSRSRRRGTPDADRPGHESNGEDRPSGGLRPLAAQLRERLGRHFPGFGG